jgi:phosphoglycolate phosphatase
MTGKESTIETVIFDYDGTLVQLNIDFDLMRQGIKRLIAEYGIAPGTLRESYILEMIAEATGKISRRNLSLGVRFQREALELVTQHEVRAAERGRILSGVPHLFKGLREQGIKIGIITRNCDRAVKMVFPDIERLSDVYLPRDCVTRVKPHTDHITLALEKMGVDNPAQCLMVGDHIMDIEGGRRMGMKTAGVLTGKITRQGFMEAGADYILEDVTAIAGIISQGQVS